MQNDHGCEDYAIYYDDIVDHMYNCGDGVICFERGDVFLDI